MAYSATWDTISYRHEVLNEALVVTHPAGYPHGEIESSLVTLVRNFVHSRSLGKVFGSSQGYAFASGEILAPDVTFISRSRWEVPSDGEFIQVVPDLLIEIVSVAGRIGGALSASTGPRDRNEKKIVYEESGVKEYWVVDPTAREISVFGLESSEPKRYGQARVVSGSQVLRSRVLPGLELQLADVFPSASVAQSLPAD